jgi:hypothetical protein
LKKKKIEEIADWIKIGFQACDPEPDKLECQLEIAQHKVCQN